MKKEYRKPELDEINIDKQITLVMMSGNGAGDIPPDPFGNTGGNDQKEDNPFASPFED